MRLLQKDCHPRMPLSGIQGFQSLKIWIPDQKRFGNDSFRIFARGSLEWFYAPPPPISGGAGGGKVLAFDSVFIFKIDENQRQPPLTPP